MNRFALLVCWVAAALLVAPILPNRCAAADAPAPAVPALKTEETNAQDLLRSFIQVQEQLHEAQLAIEQTRKEARESALNTAESLAAQLKSIETALASQRARELEAMQSSNRVMLIMAGIFAALGFVAMVLMAYFQWRTVHGLAEISAVLPNARTLGPARAMAAIGQGDLSETSAIAEQSNSRLLGALEQLEQRIYGLEVAQRPALKPAAVEPGNGQNGNGKAEASYPGESDSSGAEPAASELKGLLVKGEQLLDQDQPAAALGLFEQALELAPGHPEALVKKGSALERLGQFDRAVECYDGAIAADGSLTVAYLHKGGLFNRMQKFSEALACYEKALRTQEKR